LSEQENNNEEEESDNDEIADTFNEIKDTDLHAGNMDTLLDEIEDEGNPKYDTEYVFAPGEKKYSGQTVLLFYPQISIPT
jgi:hypothetical protein